MLPSVSPSPLGNSESQRIEKQRKEWAMWPSLMAVTDEDQFVTWAVLCMQRLNSGQAKPTVLWKSHLTKNLSILKRI